MSDASPRIILPDGSQPPVATEPESGPEVLWDKNAPQGPPQPEVRSIPDWFKPVHDYLLGTVADEGMLMDLCLERAIEIVRFNWSRGAVGIDLFPREAGGGAIGRAETLMMATPIAIELYKGSSQSLATDRRDEFKAVVEKALAAREKPAGA
jgi:hypothetical protein